MGTRRRPQGLERISVVREKLAAALRASKEALEQQAASAEILRAMSKSPGDAQPVFAAIVRSTLRLVGGHSALVLRIADGMLHLAAHSSTSASGDDALRRFYPRPIGGVIFHGRAIRSRRPYCVADTEKVPASMAALKSMARKRGYRSLLVVPMIRHGAAIGSIGVSRKQPGEFSKHQISTLETFADQAVIAIENARLFNETKEALERQTATAEILKVIASSPSDVQPVFDAIAQSARRLIGGFSALVARVDGDKIHLAAYTSTGKSGDRALKDSFPRSLDGHGPAAQAIRTGSTTIRTDIESDPDATAASRSLARARGYRSSISVPMVRDGVSIGAITVTRREPGTFGTHQIELLKTFADQAVIAIENARLFNETKEALEQQTATADILKVISRSPTDVQPVFDAIIENAMRLCDAKLGTVGLYDGKNYQHVAQRGGSPEFVAWLLSGPFVPDPTHTLGQMVAGRRPVHVPDYRELPAYQERNPRAVATVELGGARTFLAVPMLKDGGVVGGITVRRTEVRPFTQKQIDLLGIFADQAVIAIENVRLFNETKEALERQTATAEILKVISGSPTDEKPVFDAIVASAARLFGRTGRIRLLEGGELRLRARSDRQTHADSADESLAINRDTIGGRVVLERTALQIGDIQAPDAPAFAPARGAKGGYRAMAAAPLLREGGVVGVISVTSSQPGALSDKEMALLQTFADQAVIAIENTRLFNETKEALEQQTATSEVLQAISRSTFDLNAVLQVLIENATRLAGAHQGFIFRFDGELARLAYSYNAPPAYRALIEATPLAPGRGSLVGRVLLEHRPVHIPDALADREFTLHEAQRIGGFRSMLGVPMLREGKLIGVIAVWTTEVRPFTDKQIALVSTFADQAVIAIENVRLFNETKEALERQTASGEVLSVIAGTPADAQPVFDAIAQSALRLFGVSHVGITVLEGDSIRSIATAGSADPRGEFVFPLNRDSSAGRSMLDRTTINIGDTEAPDSPTFARDSGRLVGFRAIAAAPMLREAAAIGSVHMMRNTPGPFSDAQMDLLKTFANQAVIAIENARLFREIQEKSAQLEVANQHKSEFLANMSHELRTPLNAVIGFSEALMERMFGELNDKQADYLKDIHESGRHLLSLINDILDLSKIEAGRMELELSTFHLPSAIANAMTLVRERAQRHGIQLDSAIDPRLDQLTADERKVKQILLNLLSNAVKFTPDGGRVDVSASPNGKSLEIAVKDTGIGIAPEDQAQLFEEFKQVGTDAGRKAEGTGLGLALAKRFVELHGGTIRVESAAGAGSTFTVALPLAGGG